MKGDIFLNCGPTREAGFTLHRQLRHGHVEEDYENGLANGLRKSGLLFTPPHPLQVFGGDGTMLGDFFADLFVDGRLMVVQKACKALVNEPAARLLGYLRASHLAHGVLVDFSSPRMEIRKFAPSDA